MQEMTTEEKKSRKVLLSVTVDREVKDKLMDCAREDDRALSNMVNRLLREKLGFIPDED